jgi:UDP-N-acetylmuramoylalanine--D-glutamate ligase
MVSTNHPDEFAKGLRGVRVGVVGFGRTGQSVTKVLLFLDAVPITVDTRPPEQVRDLASRIEALGLRADSGPQALEALVGLPLVVVSPGVVLPADLESRLQQARTPVIAEIELAFLLSRGPIVAVTGTNGKSTTTRMVGDILAAAGIPAGVGGNIGDPLVEKAVAASPGDFLVAEVSSFQLEQCCQFRPLAAALLNIRSDHLDRHGGLDGYIAAKSRLFAQQKEDDLAVGHYDDPVVRQVVERSRARHAFFSRLAHPQPGAYLDGDDLVLALNGQPSIICAAADLPLRGAHNIENALAASLLASHCGAPPEALRAALLAFTLAEHTLEEIGIYRDLRWVNDSKGTNPAATAAALEAVGGPSVLIAGGSDKGLDFEELLPPLQDWAKALISMGQTAPQLEQVARRAGIQQVLRAANLDEAVHLAASLAEPGDTVLFSPASASFDMFRDYRDRGEQFRRAVKEGLQ